MSVAEIDRPEFVAKDLIADIKVLEVDKRSRQRIVGPSGLGTVCRHRLSRELRVSEGSAEPEPETRDRWLATVGTACHLWLAQGFRTMPWRYLVEYPVSVGHIAGLEITGTADLFDLCTGTVVDWKVVGNSRLDTYRRHGPGQQYRTQAHLYGRGFARQGFTVRNVLIMFLPRNQALGNYFPWHEPYDESVATAALDRAEGLLEVARSVPLSALSTLYPPCTDEWCPVCPVRHPYGQPGPSQKPARTIGEAVAQAQ